MTHSERASEQDSRTELAGNVSSPSSIPYQGSSIRFSLGNLLLWTGIVALGVAYAVTLSRLQTAQSELQRLRQLTGHLEPTGKDQLAAVRVPSDQPMTYRIRVRVPESPPYRVAYSSVWPVDTTGPEWFSAVSVPPGESMLIVRILKDPRDEKWKITTLRQTESGTRRSATVLPADHVKLFRGSHDWLRSGITGRTTTVAKGESLRLLDERILYGPGATMLYGDRPQEQDMIGVFAELQPDTGPL
jgi:hypothetical protein